MDSFQPSYKDHKALFFDHLLGDVLGLLQDSSAVNALRKVGYDSVTMFLGISPDIYWHKLAYMETTQDGQVVLVELHPIYINLLGVF